jgi:DNA polymerase-1
LKDIIPRLFGLKIEKFKNIFNKRNPIEHSDPVKYSEYLFRDCKYTYKLGLWCIKHLKKQLLLHYFRKLEMPTLDVLYNMQKRGVMINVLKLKLYGLKLDLAINRCLRELYRVAGSVDFNPNSNPQLKQIFFEKLNAPVLVTSKTTQKPSCNAEAVEKYASIQGNPPLREFAKALLEYRTNSKLKSTYVEGIIERVVNKKINPSYRMLLVTGRISASNPSPQTIPRGSLIRDCFVAPKGRVIISADYSQIELRIIAHLSGDKKLIKAYVDNLDVHQMTADYCGCTRDEAKVVNFSTIYLIIAKSLAKKLTQFTGKQVSDHKAGTFIDGFLDSYKGVAHWHHLTIQRAKKFGRTKTILGRPRRLEKINDTNRWIREAQYREGINHEVQGTAAELCKLAMIDCDNDSILADLSCEALIPVHDEIIFQCPIENVRVAIKRIVNLMETAFSRRGIKTLVPIKAEASHGYSWKAAKL